MIRKGRLWFTVDDKPELTAGRVTRLRTSRHDPGMVITVDAVVPEGGKWRVVFRRGDCTEHLRFLAWSGDAGGGAEAERGYTEDPLRAMNDRNEHGQPNEAVSDWWLKRFAERAAA